MKKKGFVIFLSAAMVLSMSMTAFAGGWMSDTHGKWWQGDNGEYPVNAWCWIDADSDGTAECYCFDGTGYLYTDTVTPDGYTVDSYGRWISNGEVQRQIQRKNTVANPESAGEYQNMLDIVPAYQSSGKAYKEYIYSDNGGTETFGLGGMKYTNGMIFTIQKDTWAVYNLGGNFSNLKFTLCHVDGSAVGKETTFQIFCDGELEKEISVAADMAPQEISLNIRGVNQLKLQVNNIPYGGVSYGIGSPRIR